MEVESLVLSGKHVRLEPLDLCHADGLVTASAVDPDLYQWSPIPQGRAEAVRYIETALAWRDEGSAVPFATIRVDDGDVIGSTRFFNLERWSWPPGHTRYGRSVPDACEIGYTWLASLAIRTAANTEAKLLMLAHAFETWQVLCVCFSHGRAQPAFTRCARTHRRKVRRDSPRPSDGRRLHRPRLGALLDRGGGVARCEATVASVAGSDVSSSQL
jgi:RimJ/RimL family protein N-acetyltransferase